MEVFHIVGRAPLFTNTFLILSSQGKAVAVDPYAAAYEYEKLLDEHGAQLEAILLTHGHHDHVGTALELQHKTGAKVYLRPEDARGTELFPLLPENIDVVPQDGDSIRVDDLTFAVYATPGHSEGSVGYLLGDVYFAGDTVFSGGDYGRTDLPGGDETALAHSLARLAARMQDDIQVLPGHGEFSTFGAEKRVNPYMVGACV